MKFNSSFNLSLLPVTLGLIAAIGSGLTEPAIARPMVSDQMVSDQMVSDQPGTTQSVELEGSAIQAGVMHLSDLTRSPDPTGLILMAQSKALAGSWRLANMTEGNMPTPMVPPQGVEPTAEFTDGRIFGSGGCNRFNGGYEVSGNQLSIGPLASTFMACEPAVMNQETKYLTALQGAERYEIDDQGQLTIFYQTEQGSGVLRFTSQTVRGLW